MSETITLPRSGLVLKDSRYSYFRGSVGGHLDAWVGYADNGNYQAALGAHGPKKGTRDECIAWLDARVLELRAALLPADALARALWATVLRERYGESDSWDELPTCKKDAAVAVAHSVLAALGGQP